MAAAPRPLEVQQVEDYLRTEFTGHILAQGRDAQDRDRNFLSKALAAHFLVQQAGADKAAACAASIDGRDDHGIDAVYVGATGVLWLVQSKYIHDGIGEPPLGEASKFKDGVLDFARQRFDRFNAVLQARLPEIRRAMEFEHEIRFALVHTGNSLHDDRVQLFRDAEQALNDIHPKRARFIHYALASCHDDVIRRQSEPAITAEVELCNFGIIDRPARAFYGVMQVRDLAALMQHHGHALVQANIRRYRGASEVNADIEATLRREPERFVYYNNGITLLCRRLIPVGATEPERRRGRFRLEQVSIINGAQTAGTVARLPLEHYDRYPAQVLVTCIQASDVEADFGARVTECRNRQNAVAREDFIALEERQEQWRRTLAEAGITYIVKPAADDPHVSDTVFTAREAASCLACSCAHPDGLQLLVLLRTRPERLWDTQLDVIGLPASEEHPAVHDLVFPPELTPRRLWRLTQCARLVHGIVQAGAEALGAEEAPWARASAPLVQYLVALRLRRLQDGDALALNEAERLALSRETDRVQQALLSACQRETWPDPTPEAVFADPDALLTLKTAVLRTLAAADT